MSPEELQEAFETGEELEYHCMGGEQNARLLPGQGWYPCSIDNIYLNGNVEIAFTGLYATVLKETSLMINLFTCSACKVTHPTTERTIMPLRISLAMRLIVASVLRARTALHGIPVDRGCTLMDALDSLTVAIHRWLHQSKLGQETFSYEQRRLLALRALTEEDVCIH